jgi:hypothetical protein
VPGPTGIRDDEAEKFAWAPEGLKVVNGFGATVDGNDVGIWAGSLFSDSRQGFIQVLWIYPYRSYQTLILTPAKHGALRITAERNNRLTLSAADGTVLYFDIPGLRFVPSLTAAVSTVTPPPTYTPVPVYSPRPTGYP